MTARKSKPPPHVASILKESGAGLPQMMAQRNAQLSRERDPLVALADRVELEGPSPAEIGAALYALYPFTSGGEHDLTWRHADKIYSLLENFHDSTKALHKRVHELETALAPLVAAWAKYQDKTSGPSAEGQSDAYYILAKLLGDDWERARAALAAAGRTT